MQSPAEQTADMVHGRICARSAPSPAVARSDHGGSHRAFHSWSTETASSSERSKPRTTRQQIRNVRRSPCLPAIAGSTDRRNRRARFTRSLRRAWDATVMTHHRASRWKRAASERESLRAPARFPDADTRRGRATGARACDSRSPEDASSARTTWQLNPCRARAPAASAGPPRRRVRSVASARAREADRARNGARRTEAANQAASSALPGGPDHRYPPRERHAGPPRSSAWSWSGRARRR